MNTKMFLSLLLVAGFAWGGEQTDSNEAFDLSQEGDMLTALWCKHGNFEAAASWLNAKGKETAKNVTIKLALRGVSARSKLLNGHQDAREYFIPTIKGTTPVPRIRVCAWYSSAEDATNNQGMKTKHYDVDCGNWIETLEITPDAIKRSQRWINDVGV